MTTITEDYVSFETAKLLKEKGFEGYSIITIYDENAANAYIKELQEKHLPYSSDDPKFKEFYYTKPTLQMAMKWLREEKGIAVVPIINSVLDNERFLWDVKIVVAKTSDSYSQGWNYEKQENACEAAVKYCLENLI